LLFDAYLPDDDVNDAVTTLSYFGKVDVSRDVLLSALQSTHDVVILAYGTQSSDRRQGIPGSGDDKLDGVLSAREFVAWYNGHPEFGRIGDIEGRCLRGGQSTGGAGGYDDDNDISPAMLVVVGQGNVALDVARIVVKGAGAASSRWTRRVVLDILGGAPHVSVIGRSGHEKGGFTIKVSPTHFGGGVIFLTKHPSL
jgi:adrenodoxin-NADP+ reductase